MAMSSTVAGTRKDAKSGGAAIKSSDLPPHIRKLSYDHPQRIEFEEELLAAQDGGWLSPEAREALVDFLHSTGLKILAVVVISTGMLLYYELHYRQKVDTLRDQFRTTLALKGLDEDATKIAKEYPGWKSTPWAPVLEGFLDKARGAPSRGDLVYRPRPNPEDGSYMDYIRANEESFDEGDALTWLVNTYRQATNKPVGKEPSLF